VFGKRKKETKTYTFRNLGGGWTTTDKRPKGCGSSCWDAPSCMVVTVATVGLLWFLVGRRKKQR
jgi:hypothetical protein